MTNTAYTLIALGTGAIISGLITQFITEKVLTAKFERETEEERQKIKEYYKEKYGTPCNIGSEDTSDKVRPNPGETKFSKSSIDYHTVDTHKTNYATNLGDHEEYTFNDERRHDQDIYVVSFAEGCEADPGWNMISLKYYCDDGVLTDENDTPVDETLIGDGLDHFGENPDDPYTVYVKNKKVKHIYEISAIDANYAMDILGLDPEPAERRTRKGREK